MVAAPMASSGFSGPTASPAENPPRSDVGSTLVPPTLSEVTGTPPVTSVPASGDAPTSEIPSHAATPPVIPPVPPVTPPSFRPPSSSSSGVAAAAAWQRAGFFIRLGALALDGILIGLIMAFVSNLLPHFLRFNDGPGGWLIVLAIYGAVMWKHKGTTIGGIVCGLKVVRVDNRELDWATAIVRALGCFLSLAVAGLGFIWVAIDDDKQSWHDKIAGTTVVLVPKGVSLL
jgi:uncharacterized RDD family membrane protein YckC